MSHFGLLCKVDQKTRIFCSFSHRNKSKFNSFQFSSIFFKCFMKNILKFFPTVNLFAQCMWSIPKGQEIVSFTPNFKEVLKMIQLSNTKSIFGNMFVSHFCQFHNHIPRAAHCASPICLQSGRNQNSLSGISGLQFLKKSFRPLCAKN